MKISIRNAMIVESSGIVKENLTFENGKIIYRGDNIEADSEIIEGEGLQLYYGVLDPQVHFRDPGLEHKEDIFTGSRAAAAGGVTSFFDMPNTKPPTISREAMEIKKAIAAQKSLVNYNFFIGATSSNLDELNLAKNICGIKIFMGSSTGNLLVENQDEIENIFANTTQLIAVHAETEKILKTNYAKYAKSTDVKDHPFIRSPEAALDATKFAVKLAKKYRRRLHILHLTTGDEVDFLRQNKEPWISAEVCPQHFLLSWPKDYDRLGTYVQMNPPIRSIEHAQKLWQGLLDGVIDCIATDHAPHTHNEKKQPFGKSPAGMPGVETSFPLLLNLAGQKECKYEQVSQWMCEKPYELYRVANKGKLKPGFDADLVLVDPEKKQMIENGKLFCKVNWSPYDGWELIGWPIKTIVGGNIVFDSGKIFNNFKGREIKILEDLTIEKD